jgi:hypothetical protein
MNIAQIELEVLVGALLLSGGGLPENGSEQAKAVQKARGIARLFVADIEKNGVEANTAIAEHPPGYVNALELENARLCTRVEELTIQLDTLLAGINKPTKVVASPTAPPGVADGPATGSTRVGKDVTK